eukprot:CAMPEP_0175285636 /NCGR_PEP_ID=MMETSP0093-20121207/53342_1 /TAXON_ID=311494 /ORGANISM="Alexandrium monilatum, Strain CCMP3105" /LENGTH=90 /DNA_ID=CAMNT_0016581061 /DNA_START=9 /DNA_END=277 /DNA_ORIENTATION=+
MATPVVFITRVTRRVALALVAAPGRRLEDGAKRGEECLHGPRMRPVPVEVIDPLAAVHAHRAQLELGGGLDGSGGFHFVHDAVAENRVVG